MAFAGEAPSESKPLAAVVRCLLRRGEEDNDEEEVVEAVLELDVARCC